MSPLEQVLAHAAGRPPSCGAVRVIAVDGRSGSGKTSLGRRLAAAWDAPLVSMDSIYPGWGGLARSVTLLVEHVLDPLATGRGPIVPTWDWLAERPGPMIPLAVDDRLVIEGCASTVAEAGEAAGTRVWLEADATVRRERALARDGAVFQRHWEMWAAQEEELFSADGTRERAHVLIDAN